MNNVLTATRFFDHRVKKFISLIVMGSNNPMCVQYYTYKVEFQERGAGHIHGVLWLDLPKMETLVRGRNNELMIENSEDSENSESKERPFKGLAKIFHKLKNQVMLDKNEIDVLVTFIDEFTTVSTNEDEVGKDVSDIVLQVNRHTHTKSCKKYGNNCRFSYPRFPSRRTIIAEPISDNSSTNKKERMKQYNEVLEKVHYVLTDSDLIDEIVSKTRRLS